MRTSTEVRTTGGGGCDCTTHDIVTLLATAFVGTVPITVLVDTLLDTITIGINYANSLVVSGGALQLSGDVLAPGADTYYGTNALGVKGWYANSTNTCGFNVVKEVVGIGDGLQTVFTLANTPASGFIPFVDGLTIANADYIRVGTTLTLAVAPGIGEKVEVIYTVNTSGTALTFDEYTVGVGNGAQTVFTLPATPSNNQSAVIFVDGLTNQLAVDYSIVGTTLTFVVAPASGEVVTAMIDTSHNATFAKFIAPATGIGQSFTLPSTAVKTLHVSVDSLTTTNHTTSGASITVNDTVTIGDIVTIVYLDNATCVSTGGTVENQRLVLSGSDLSITEADGTTILNTVTLPSGGAGTNFDITDDLAVTNNISDGTNFTLIGGAGTPIKTIFTSSDTMEIKMEGGSPGQVVGYDEYFGAGWVNSILTYSDIIIPIGGSPLVISHNWGTTKVQVSVYDTATGEQVTPTTVSRDSNDVRVTMPVSNEIEIVIIGFI